MKIVTRDGGNEDDGKGAGPRWLTMMTSRQGGFSRGPPIFITVGQLPCGVCPTTRRVTPQLLSSDATSSIPSACEAGMPSESRCRPITTDGSQPGTT